MNELKKKTNVKPFLLILAGILYVLSPIDFIPDVIPFLGNLDDLGVIGILVQRYIAYRLETEGQALKTPAIDASVKALK